jgi:cytochrome c-type biogenesis protein CcsB
MGTLSFELALTFYFASVVIGLVELFTSTKTTTRLMLGAATLGLIMHTGYIIGRYVAEGHFPVASAHEATSFFAWCIVVLFLALETRHRVGLLGSFVMPVVMVLLIAASLFSREVDPGLSPVLKSNWFAVHTFLAFVGDAAFALACGVGVMYLVQEHYVKGKHLGGLFQRLPSLQDLDYINYRLITIGFPLLTLAIISGAIWAQKAWGGFWRWDPREVWALITWLIYALILHARLLAGWRGRRAAILSIVGFASILIAFFGIKLLQKGLHVF